MLKYIITVLFFALSGQVFADNTGARRNAKVGYTVSPLTTHISHPGDYVDIVVNNSKDQTLYFQTKFVKLKMEADGKETKIPLNDYSIIASPNKLAVPANSKGTVRLSVVKPLEKGASYGFLISPVEGKLITPDTKKGMKMLLQCIIEYMVRIKPN